MVKLAGQAGRSRQRFWTLLDFTAVDFCEVLWHMWQTTPLSPRAGLLLALLAGMAAAADTSAAAPRFLVSAYVPEYRMGGLRWDAVARRATDLVLFSLEPDPAGPPPPAARASCLPRPAPTARLHEPRARRRHRRHRGTVPVRPARGGMGCRY